MKTSPPTLDQIRQTAQWLEPSIIRTPSLPYYGDQMDRLMPSGTDVWLKLELLQKTGSFKPRGALNVIRHLNEEQKKRGVTAFSAGNHAIATAFAAANAGISAKVVMPASANAFRVDRCLSYGAEIVFADDMKSLFAVVEDLEQTEGRTLIHPFEGPHTTAGTATVGLELYEDVPDLDAVIVPVGGGGLISGIASCSKALNPACKVYGVEPVGAQGMSESLRQGAPVESVDVDSIADSLSAPMHKRYSFEIVQQTVDEIVTVTDDELIEAMKLMFGDLKLAVEPAGAAAMAALLGPLKSSLAGKRCGIIVCGTNIDAASFSRLTL